MKNIAAIEMKSVINGSEMNVFSISSLMKRVSILLKKAGATIVNSRFALSLAALFSFILDEKVSPAKSLHIVNACVAGTAAFLFGGFSVMVQIVLLAWFAVAVWQCRKSA